MNNNKATMEVTFDEEGNCHIRRQLDVPQGFIDECRRKYEESKTRRAFDNEAVFELPDFLYFAWLAEGYDAGQEDVRTTMKKMRREGLDYLITSAKFD